MLLAPSAVMENDALPIEAIKELVNGHTVKVQVRLDEDATDQQIMSALDDACRAWAGNITTGAALRLLVGRILVAVRARGIHKQEPWGTFDAFVTKEIEQKYGIGTRDAYECIELVTGLHDLSPKETRIPAGRLLLVAKAVNRVAPQNKAKVREKWLRKAAEKGISTDDFREELRHATLLRSSNRHSRIKLATITFQVPVDVAERWRQIVGRRAASMVFTEWVEEHGPRRKSMGKERAVEDRATA